MSILQHRRKAFRAGATNPTTANLVQHWDLDNITTGLNSDTGGFGLTNGTFGNACTNGGATSGPGGDKGSISMTDIQYVHYDNGGTNTIAYGSGKTKLSVSIWADTTSVSSGGNWLCNWRELVTSGLLHQVYIRNVTTPDLAAVVWDDVSAGEDIDVVLSGVAPASSGTWQHVVQTWDGTDHKIYVDGVEKQSSTPGDIGTLEDVAMPFALGTAAWSKGTDTRGHVGKLALCSIFDDDLTPSEVTWLYNDGDGRAYSEY